MMELGKSHSRPADAIEELGCSKVSLPLVKIDGFTRLLAKPAAQRQQDAFGNEDRREPEQQPGGVIRPVQRVTATTIARMGTVRAATLSLRTNISRSS